MSDCNNEQHLDSAIDNESSKLCTCLFSTQPQFVQSVEQLLNGDRYKLIYFSLIEKLVDFIAQNKEQIDCIILVNSPKLSLAVDELRQSEVLLPAVIVETDSSFKEFADSEQEDKKSPTDTDFINILYHPAEIHLYTPQLKEINSYIGLAISKFLNLAPESENNNCSPNNKVDREQEARNCLATKQRKLTNKIKERLGYLGVYYKRNASDFYRNLPPEDQQELNYKLTNKYRQILLSYFDSNLSVNNLIDEFVDLAFFADVSTSQILEIHMDLLDSFSHQLQIEGRGDDILLDYRLPLIDVISHFCEIYRRSIPEEDVSLDLLFGVK